MGSICLKYKNMSKLLKFSSFEKAGPHQEHIRSRSWRKAWAASACPPGLVFPSHLPGSVLGRTGVFLFIVHMQQGQAWIYLTFFFSCKQQVSCNQGNWRWLRLPTPIGVLSKVICVAIMNIFDDFRALTTIDNLGWTFSKWKEILAFSYFLFSYLNK